MFMDELEAAEKRIRMGRNSPLVKRGTVRDQHLEDMRDSFKLRQSYSSIKIERPKNPYGPKDSNRRGKVYREVLK